MKIAIPTDDKKMVANHFGRCLVYVCFDENGKELEEFKNTSEHMGGKGLPPELLKDSNVDVLLCRDLGPNAIRLCQNSRIKVFKDSNATLIADLFSNWQAGKLIEATLDEGCESHR